MCACIGLCVCGCVSLWVHVFVSLAADVDPHLLINLVLRLGGKSSESEAAGRTDAEVKALLLTQHWLTSIKGRDYSLLYSNAGNDHLAFRKQ